MRSHQQSCLAEWLSSRKSMLTRQLLPTSAHPHRLLLELPVDALGAAGELDEPVPLDRCMALDGLLGLGDLLIDCRAASAAPARGGTGNRSPRRAVRHSARPATAGGA